eukprot:GHVS01034983.1.p2 GENE.GHVS01034983.1~~GHVS01034983.1.p2  ORF type:complete len:503 (-),score=90.15 GHVS01034983.1:2598-4106(-)
MPMRIYGFEPNPKARLIAETRCRLAGVEDLVRIEHRGFSSALEDLRSLSQIVSETPSQTQQEQTVDVEEQVGGVAVEQDIHKGDGIVGDELDTVKPLDSSAVEENSSSQPSFALSSVMLRSDLQRLRKAYQQTYGQSLHSSTSSLPPPSVVSVCTVLPWCSRLGGSPEESHRWQGMKEQLEHIAVGDQVAQKHLSLSLLSADQEQQLLPASFHQPVPGRFINFTQTYTPMQTHLPDGLVQLSAPHMPVCADTAVEENDDGGDQSGQGRRMYGRSGRYSDFRNNSYGSNGGGNGNSQYSNNNASYDYNDANHSYRNNDYNGSGSQYNTAGTGYYSTHGGKYGSNENSAGYSGSGYYDSPNGRGAYNNQHVKSGYNDNNGYYNTNSGTSSGRGHAYNNHHNNSSYYDSNAYDHTPVPHSATTPTAEPASYGHPPTVTSTPYRATNDGGRTDNSSATYGDYDYTQQARTTGSEDQQIWTQSGNGYKNNATHDQVYTPSAQDSWGM